ncbi:hypothetical protein R69619_02582 [Paraburkholderia nemoris]|nr:hypothetical protein R69619_02582 [Paraburkholderia nemoris]
MHRLGRMYLHQWLDAVVGQLSTGLITNYVDNSPLRLPHLKRRLHCLVLWARQIVRVDRCSLASRQGILLLLQLLGWDVRRLSTGLPTFYGDKFFCPLRYRSSCLRRWKTEEAQRRKRATHAAALSKRPLKPSTPRPPRLPAIAPAKPHPAYRASAAEELRSTSSHLWPRAPSTSHHDHESHYPT